MRFCFRTFTIKPLSFVRRSTWLFTLRVTASRSRARLSLRPARRSWLRPTLMDFSASWSCAGISFSMVSTGSCAALTAPQSSCPRTTSTFTFKWCTAYCSDASVAVSRALPATRTTKMSPRPWSKMISVGTRESEQPRMATTGDCLEMSARRSKALASGRTAAPVQNRALPRCRSSKTSWGGRARALAWEVSACFRASSMEKPCQ
mmetsp:Transcript_13859/g.31687  ORF Transcript_13859/g.31687 Transcript_13859/m.31687 type:complete len:205 (+) Transcript_13859:49-663(+)